MDSAIGLGINCFKCIHRHDVHFSRLKKTEHLLSKFVEVQSSWHKGMSLDPIKRALKCYGTNAHYQSDCCSIELSHL